MKKMKLTLASVIVAGRCYKRQLQMINFSLQNYPGAYDGSISDSRLSTPFAKAACIVLKSWFDTVGSR